MRREPEAKLLQSLKKLPGLRVLAGETPAGKIDDLLVEEQSWKLEYAAVENGGALAHRIRIVRYEHLGGVSPDGRSVVTTLSPEELEQLSIEGVQSVSDRMESEATQQLGSADSRLGGGPKPATHGVLDDGELERARSAAGAGSGPGGEGKARTELQRIGELTKYRVEGLDGAHFPVCDFMADATTGVLRYVVIETPGLKPGSGVLLPPPRICEVSWPRWRIHAKGRAEDFKKLNHFDPRSQDDLNRN